MAVTALVIRCIERFRVVFTPLGVYVLASVLRVPYQLRVDPILKRNEGKLNLHLLFLALVGGK